MNDSKLTRRAMSRYPSVVSRHLTYNGAGHSWSQCYVLKQHFGMSSGWRFIEWEIRKTWYGYRVQVRARPSDR